MSTSDSEQGSDYVVLMETSEENNESWYYFIKWIGNEENLKHLNNQLESIEDPSMLDGINDFHMDIENKVSEDCAKQMIMLDLNFTTYHRKFDGKLDKIDFGFKEKHKDVQKLCKVHEILGEGAIDQFIDDEDVPEEHLRDNDSVSSNSVSLPSSEDEDMDSEMLPESLKELKL